MANIFAFNINKAFLPFATGLQLRLYGAGGPSGNPFGTATPKPWPYITGTPDFYYNLPYGSASSSASPFPWPYATSNPGTLMQGLVKQSTFGNVVF